MTKRSKRRGEGGRTPALGRGQEEFTGDFASALDAVQRERDRRAKSSKFRARERYSYQWANPESGPMRPYVVGWKVVEYSMETDCEITASMGRSVIFGRSVASVRARAPRRCLREAHRERMGLEGFQIRYIKEAA